MQSSIAGNPKNPAAERNNPAAQNEDLCKFMQIYANELAEGEGTTHALYGPILTVLLSLNK